MNISKESFIFCLIKSISTLKYFYKETVYDAIKALRENYSYNCEENDDEIYQEFLEKWTLLN